MVQPGNLASLGVSQELDKYASKNPRVQEHELHLLFIFGSFNFFPASLNSRMRAFQQDLGN